MSAKAVSLGFALLVSAQVASADVPYIFVPESCANLDACFPLEAEIVDRKSGDLNGDGRADHVLVLKHKDDTHADRRVLVVMADVGRAFKRLMRDEGIVPSAAEGGAASNDAYMGLSIDGQSFIVEKWGGSNITTSEKDRYALRDGAFRLVEAVSSTSSGTPGAMGTDWAGFSAGPKEVILSYRERVDHDKGERTETWTIANVETEAEREVFRTSPVK